MDDSYRQPGSPEVGAKIRAARELAGLSLREASRLFECSPAMLSMLETGQRAPSRRLAGKIIDHLPFDATQALEVWAIGVKPKPYVPHRARGRTGPTIISGYQPRVPFRGNARGPTPPKW